MKHFLFSLTLILNILLCSEYVYAQKPCIKINGEDPTPSGIPDVPPYTYKCSSSSVSMEVIDCFGNFVDPSQYDSRIWYDPTRYAINGPIMLDAFSPGIWTLVITYTDPVFGTVIEDSVKVNIINYPAPTGSDLLTIASANTPASHCKDEIMTFSVNTSSFYVSDSFKWFANTVANDTTTTVIATGTSVTQSINTATHVTVMATDVNGCKQRATKPAPLKTSPTPPNLGADIYRCAGTSVVLKPYETPPANYTYYWNGDEDGSTLEITHTTNTAGKYWVTVENFPTQPCKVTDTIYVFDVPAPNFSISNDTSVCYQASGSLHASSASPLTFTWTPSTYFPGGNNGTNPTIDFNGIATGAYTINVEARDANNCTTTKSLNVTHLDQGSNPYMTVSIPALNICGGAPQAFTTNATTTYTTVLSYEWLPSTHLNNALIKEPTVDLTGQPENTPFSYAVKVTDSKGCYITVNTTAALAPAVTANVAFNDSSICRGNTIILQSSATGGTGSLSYAWTPTLDLNDATIANPSATPTQNRVYSLTVTDSKGCKDVKTIDLKAINVIVSLIPTDTFGYSMETMVLNPIVNSNTYTYQWWNVTTATSLGTDQMQVALESARYAVVATEPIIGCYASDSINVTIQVGNPRLIYVPNVLNPASSNPENKTVKVYGTAVLEDDFAFRIYNKWGEMIYETTSFTDANTNGWNGVYKSSNGTEQNLSVYTYSLHGKFFDGQEFDKTGSITLMR